MKLLPSTTAILFIWITLQMVRLDDPDDPGKCLRVVNIIRKEVGVEPLKEEDKIEKARLMKKFEPGTKNCPTKDHLENGLDGFTVGRVGGYREEVVVPNGVLTPVIKTFVCIELDCVDHHDITFFFMKNGIDGPPIKNSGTKTFTVTEDMVRKGAPEKASSSGFVPKFDTEGKAIFQEFYCIDVLHNWSSGGLQTLLIELIFLRK